MDEYIEPLRNRINHDDSKEIAIGATIAVAAGCFAYWVGTSATPTATETLKAAAIPALAYGAAAGGLMYVAGILMSVLASGYWTYLQLRPTPQDEPTEEEREEEEEEREAEQPAFSPPIDDEDLVGSVRRYSGEWFDKTNWEALGEHISGGGGLSREALKGIVDQRFYGGQGARLPFPVLMVRIGAAIALQEGQRGYMWTAKAAEIIGEINEYIG